MPIRRQLMAQRHAFLSEGVRERAFSAQNGMLAFTFDDAEAVIREIEASGAALTAGGLWLRDRGGDPHEPQYIGFVKGKKQELSYFWECPRNEGESWSDFVTRTAADARSRITPAREVTQAADDGYEPFLHFKWVTETELALFAKPPETQVLDPLLPVDNSAGLMEDLQGPTVRRAAPTAPGSMYGRDVATNVEVVPADARLLHIEVKARNFERLLELKQLESLRIAGRGTNDRHLAVLARHTSLRSLNIVDLASTNFDALAGSRLSELSCWTAAKVTDVSALGMLTDLRMLTLSWLKNLPDLKSFADLTQLSGLALHGTTHSRWTAPDFKPLAALTGLRNLDISSVGAKDGSLRPLAALHGLRSLDLANYFKLEEFAILAAALTELETGAFTSFWWREPDPDVRKNFLGACKRCKSFVCGMTIGKPMKQLCPQCDAAQVAKMQARWDAAVAKERAALGVT